jgi:hypothetical protein
LIAIVRDWQSRMTPEQARMATENMIGYGIVDWPQEGPLSVDAALAEGEPVPTLAAPLPEPPPRTPKRAKPPQRAQWRLPG